MTTVHRRSFASTLLACVICAASPAFAQPVPDYNYDWVRITHPGNRSPTGAEAPSLMGSRPVGAVDYEYRITRTEVTVSQWFEFVQAYAPYYTGYRNDPSFTSLWISASSLDPNQPPGYHMAAGAANYPAGFSWRNAARFVNWLNNGKHPERAAFESGAYDTSTFTEDPDHTQHDQPAHDPSARFWIPTVDEWSKAVYYDPNRYGPGQDGYWMNPGASDLPLIPGLPGQGQTSAGLPSYSYVFDVGSYPDVQTPWGLLDASGGVTEWTETLWGANDPLRDRFYRSSVTGSQLYLNEDRLDEYSWFYDAPFTVSGGVRLVSAVPDAPTAAVLALGGAMAAGRRRRFDRGAHGQRAAPPLPEGGVTTSRVWGFWHGHRQLSQSVA